MNVLLFPSLAAEYTTGPDLVSSHVTGSHMTGSHVTGSHVTSQPYVTSQAYVTEHRYEERSMDDSDVQESAVQVKSYEILFFFNKPKKKNFAENLDLIPTLMTLLKYTLSK